MGPCIRSSSTFTPEYCDCPRSPDCHGKFVVNMPDTDTPNRLFRDYDEAEAMIRTPSHDQLVR